MLWHHLKAYNDYRTILIFQNKNNPAYLRVKTWGGGKRHVIPPMSKNGGINSPIPPGIYALAPYLPYTSIPKLSLIQGRSVKTCNCNNLSW